MKRVAVLWSVGSSAALVAVVALIGYSARMPQPVSPAGSNAEMIADNVCSNLVSLKLSQASITKAQAFGPGFVPPANGNAPWHADKKYVARAFCRISGVAGPTEAQPSSFEMWLPAVGWNKKYDAIGEEGDNTLIPYGSMTDAINRGYATGSITRGDSLKRQSQHFAIQAGKQIIADYYSQKASFAYFSTCGTADFMSQVDPHDVDGILAGELTDRDRAAQVTGAADRPVDQSGPKVLRYRVGSRPEAGDKTLPQSASASATASTRLFAFPQTARCASANGPANVDALGSLESWVERNVAPDRIVASVLQGTTVTGTQLLCAYPKRPFYIGHGPVGEAASFECREG